MKLQNVMSPTPQRYAELQTACTIWEARFLWNLCETVPFIISFISSWNTYYLPLLKNPGQNKWDSLNSSLFDNFTQYAQSNLFKSWDDQAKYLTALKYIP